MDFAIFAALAAAYIASALTGIYAARRDADWEPRCHLAAVMLAAAMCVWAVLAGSLVVAVVAAVVLMPVSACSYRAARRAVVLRGWRRADYLPF